MDTLVESNNTMLRVRLKNRSGTIPDLAGSSVTFSYSIDSGSTQTRLMNVVSPASDGIAQCRFGSGELVPGVMAADIHVQDANGNNLSTRKPIYFRVRRKN